VYAGNVRQSPAGVIFTRMRGILVVLAVWFGCVGCVERTLTVRSDPPEALLYLNGTEVGRTPFTHDFTYYGWYDVEVRKEGYETLKTTGQVIAPWWQWVPFDFFAELSPIRLRDKQMLSYSLRPTSAAAVDPQKLLNRAEEMRPKLESSEHTRQPTTRAGK
jgi:hypothetical protein